MQSEYQGKLDAAESRVAELQQAVAEAQNQASSSVSANNQALARMEQNEKNYVARLASAERELKKLQVTRGWGGCYITVEL